MLKAAAETLTHVHLELGGKNAIIVLDDADLELAVDGILWSAFGTSGQRCTAASRVIVQKGAYDELQTRLVDRVEKLRLGPGWEDDTDIGPVINRTALEKIHSYTEIGKDEGAKLLTGGEVAGRRRSRQGLLLPPDRLRGRRPADADRAGGDLRPDDGADPGRATSTRRSASRTGSSTASRPRSSRGTSTLPSARCATSRRASPTSTPARSAPRCTSRSAARRTPATATARRARPRSTCSPSGSRSTSTTPAGCNAPRSTPKRTRHLRYRQLGDSDLRVSEICLGTWTTFGGSLADDAAIALVDAAFEHGRQLLRHRERLQRGPVRGGARPRARGPAARLVRRRDEGLRRECRTAAAGFRARRC